MSQTGNRFLDVLPPALRDTLSEAARTVELPTRMRLQEAGENPQYLYLLTAGAVSTVVSMREGGSAEVGMVGPEGIVGVTSLLGSARPQSVSFVQIAGYGYRVPLRVMQTLFEDSTEFRNRALQFLQTQIVILGQLSACNRLHEAEARLARWLLTAADLTQSSTLALTQEFLSQMLGSQRTTVALVAGILQRGGSIEYSRGKVRIIRREGLEACACDCYRLVKAELAKLYQ